MQKSFGQSSKLVFIGNERTSVVKRDTKHVLKTVRTEIEMDGGGIWNVGVGPTELKHST